LKSLDSEKQTLVKASKFASVYVRLFAFAWAALAGERAVLASSAATPHFPRLKGERPFAGRLAFD
jgi:hypothetical protein